MDFRKENESFLSGKINKQRLIKHLGWVLIRYWKNRFTLKAALKVTVSTFFVVIYCYYFFDSNFFKAKVLYFYTIF